MIKTNSFEQAYGELMDGVVSLEIKDNKTMYFTYKSTNGIIKMKMVDQKQYISEVERINYRMRVTVNGIYIEGKINCFIENGILYLDENIPFATQIKELDRIKNYFFVPYKSIYYNGEVNWMEKLLFKGRLKNSTSISGDSKTDVILISIKMQLSKLDFELKEYVEKRINKIYSKPEERLKEYVDLTKPIESVESFSVNEQLERLSNQMPILVKASKYVKELMANKKTNVLEGIAGVDPETIQTLSTQIEKEYSEHYSLVHQNAIAEVEGREHQELEDIAREFAEQIDATNKLLRDYYSKNSSTFDLLFNGENNSKLIIARINSIYSFYMQSNPYAEKIKEYDGRIKKAIDDREDPNQIVEEYNRFLKKALQESENFAFDSIINSWEKHINRVISGTNPILVEIGTFVEQYTKSKTALESYMLRKVTGRYGEEKVKETINSEYELVFLNIISRISATYYSTRQENSMIEIDKEKEYQSLLNELKELIELANKNLAYLCRQDTINDFFNDIFINMAEEDPEFTALFNKVESAYYALGKLEDYANTKDLFNLSVIKPYFDSNKGKYQGILVRIKGYYENGGNSHEYTEISDALDQLINDVYTICENEEKLLGKFNEISTQKRRI